MFENVCTLPLSAEVFAQAIHPTLPIVVVGLATGHVQAFRLPPADPSSEASTPPEPKAASDSNGTPKPNGSQPHTARARSSSITSTTGPINTVSTIWRTRRHKGSCRALAFSTDGSTLFSTGTDGLLKAADALTGRVTAKHILPSAQHSTNNTTTSTPDAPSTLLALSPQALVLGTDSGQVHIYTLDANSLPSASPAQTFRPHRTDDDPGNAEAIAALAALPPSLTSSSGTSRAFVSAAGATLAVTDIRKGVIACSIDQGDVLLSACCASLAAPPGKAVQAQGTKRKKGPNADEAHNPNDKVLVGGSEGLLTLWNRGEWADQRSRVSIGGGGLAGPLGPDDGDAGVECLAVMPLAASESGSSRTRIVAAGLGSGAVKLVEVRTGKGSGVAQVVGEVSHDERGVEGVVAVGFEAEGGRLITAGGEIVKVWALKGEESADADGWVDTDDSGEEQGEEEDLEDADKEEDDSEGEDSDEKDEDEEEDEDSDEDEPEKRSRKKRRRGKKENVGAHGHHGVLAFKGMD